MEAWTVEGDENNIYVTTYASNAALISYKKNSNGLILGSSYRDSTNSTLQLGSYGLTHLSNGTLYATVQDERITKYITATNPLPLNPRAVTNETLVDQWGVFADRHSFVWTCFSDMYYSNNVGYVTVFDNNANLLAHLSLPNMTDVGSYSCETLFIMDDDTLLYSSSFGIVFVFQIMRDTSFKPVSLIYSKKSYLSDELVTGMCADKWNNLFMLEYDESLYNINNKGVRNLITLPKCQEVDTMCDWRDVWIDPQTNFVFLVGETRHVYVLEYNKP